MGLSRQLDETEMEWKAYSKAIQAVSRDFFSDLRDAWINEHGYELFQEFKEQGRNKRLSRSDLYETIERQFMSLTRQLIPGTVEETHELSS